MQFRRLAIRNLRAVDAFEIDDLKDFVVIAGQNGSGKSCVFDAIRLLKSIYGGYAIDEHMQWFGELGVNVQDRRALERLFRQPTMPITVSGDIELADSEVSFLNEHAEELALPIAWQRITGQRIDQWTFNQMALATQMAQYKEPVQAMAKQVAEAARGSLASRTLTLALQIEAGGAVEITPSIVAELAFQTYRPESLGVIEYHSASRSYSRQELGGINLDARSFADQRRQQTLYNWQSKYQNVKTELASSYLRSLIATQADGEPEGEDLNSTLQELFQTFFPDKEYLGVRPLAGGSLEFPVRLSNGRTHDIDDLSSGEKEILYGYLRLRNSTPRNSVVLLDEPELHLNPSLLQGFTDFYYRHLGIAQGNQLWLVTHSDTLLRQAVGNSNYRVYHMTPATAAGFNTNQAAEVLLENDVERVTVDLVGDLASYRPHAKVVVFEGEGIDGFDVTMVRRLFPDFARRVNLVSGGNKQRVKNLYEVLHRSAEQLGIQNRFFAVVDKDASPFPEISMAGHEYAWDVYHIENYLLNSDAIRGATIALRGSSACPADIEDALRLCAAELVDRLVLERLQKEINAALVNAISIGASPDSNDLVRDLMPSIEGSKVRLNEVVDLYSAADHLADRDREVRETLRESLDDGSWLAEFPGRLILNRYVNGFVSGVSYEAFRNLVLDRMAEAADQPDGMQSVLSDISAAS